MDEESEAAPVAGAARGSRQHDADTDAVDVVADDAPSAEGGATVMAAGLRLATGRALLAPGEPGRRPLCARADRRTYGTASLADESRPSRGEADARFTHSPSATTVLDHSLGRSSSDLPA